MAEFQQFLARCYHSTDLRDGMCGLHQIVFCVMPLFRRCWTRQSCQRRQSAGIFTLMAQRVDVVLAERGHCRSRSQAKALIQEGKVLLNGIPVTKPSTLTEEDDVLTLTEGMRYVGRGGLKLEGALKVFPVRPEGRICMDVGASTGGFTDCMLRNGAVKVYAVDVGHGQLDASLRRDERVTDLEGTDVRRLSDLPETPDFCTIDVSFISLRLVLPAVYALLSEQAECIALVKPQFEAGKANIGKGGIVRSARVHEQVLREVLGFAQETGFSVEGVCVSPVQGGDGNTEYLAYLKKGCPLHTFPDVQTVVAGTGLKK